MILNQKSGGSGNCPDAPDPSSGTVNFCNGQAQGAMTGWGWVALGELDTITDPTCDTDNHEITKANPCTSTTNWDWNSTPDALCINASIPALPASPVQADYDANWGVQIGVSSSEPPADKGGTTLGDTFASVAISYTGTPSTGLRAELHRLGDIDDITYCANIQSSGTSIALTAFNTHCWDNGGDGLTEADIPNIDKVGIQVSSGSKEITVEKLCLTKVEFMK